MEKRDLTCIGCPLGCQITVTMENGEVTDVKGNTCPRGDKYAREEVTNPTRRWKPCRCIRKDKRRYSKRKDF